MESGEQIRTDNLRPLRRNFFDDKVDAVSRNLIGVFLMFDHGIGDLTGGRIVETEAYDQDDPAAHCYRSADYKPGMSLSLLK